MDRLSTSKSLQKTAAKAAIASPQKRFFCKKRQKSGNNHPGKGKASQKAVFLDKFAITKMSIKKSFHFSLRFYVIMC
jgi:hypothetical protein